jgi:hypothetical protein
MKPLKTKSKPILKNVVINWCGEINFKILKKKLINSMKIKVHLDISITYPIGHRNFDKHKKSFQKDF